MEKKNTAERLREIMQGRSLRQIDILERAAPYCKEYGVKLGKSDLSQYVSGKVEPGQEKLTILALALDVSEAWLMGFDVPARPETRGEQLGSLWAKVSRDQELIRALEKYISLSNDKKEVLLKLIDILSGE